MNRTIRSETPLDIPVQYEGFEGKRLAVRPAGWLSGPKLLVDGTPARREKGRYLVRNNTGNQVEVKLKYQLDPVPKIEIAGRVLELARPLRWYEYVWMCLPLLLLFIGGAVGGLCGGGGVYVNAHIFRSDRSSVAKYLLTGVVSVGAVVAYVGLVMVLVVLFPALFKR